MARPISSFGIKTTRFNVHVISKPALHIRRGEARVPPEPSFFWEIGRKFCQVPPAQQNNAAVFKVINSSEAVVVRGSMLHRVGQIVSRRFFGIKKLHVWQEQHT